jgi:hypothetical protein
MLIRAAGGVRLVDGDAHLFREAGCMRGVEAVAADEGTHPRSSGRGYPVGAECPHADSVDARGERCRRPSGNSALLTPGMKCALVGKLAMLHRRSTENLLIIMNDAMIIEPHVAWLS